MKRRVIIALVSLMSVLGTAPVASATDEPKTSSRVTIDGHALFSGGVSTFVARGGGLCGSGTTSDVVTSIFIPPNTGLFDVKKTFICDDHSGTFTMRLRAVVHFCDTFDQGSWEITGGTGDYRDLSGKGRIVGTYFPNDSCSADGVDDHYTGSVRQGDDR